MFAVYSPQGLKFSGALEQIRRVNRSAGSSSSRNSAESLFEDDDVIYDGSTREKGGDTVGADVSVSPSALQHYKSMLSDRGQPEPALQVFQIMTKRVVVLNAKWQISRAIEIFKTCEHNVLPVVNDFGQLRGALSRRGLHEHLLAPEFDESFLNGSIGAQFLKQDTETFAVNPVTDVRRLSQLLIEQNLDALPVVSDSEEVIGVVSRTDILRCATANPPLSLWC